MEDSKTSHGLAELLRDEIKNRWREFLDIGPHRGLKILITNRHNPYNPDNQCLYLDSMGLSKEDYGGIFKIVPKEKEEIGEVGGNQISSISGNNALTIGSWNIQLGIRHEKIIELLQDGFGLDVVALQEVTRFHKWSNYEDLLDVIVGKTCFTNITYAPSFIFPNEKTRPFPELGNAILSRHSLSEGRVIRLGQVHDWHKDKPYPRLGERVALYSTVQINGGIGVYCTQLEVRCPTSARVKQLGQIFDDADSVGNPRVVVVGDFNEWALIKPKYETDEITQLAIQRGYDDHFGESSSHTNNIRLLAKLCRLFGSKFTLDRIMSKGFRVKEFDVMYNINLTDHFPVKAVFGYK